MRALGRVKAARIGHYPHCLFIQLPFTQVKCAGRARGYRAPSHQETNPMHETRKNADAAHTLLNLPAARHAAAGFLQAVLRP